MFSGPPFQGAILIIGINFVFKLISKKGGIKVEKELKEKIKAEIKKQLEDGALECEVAQQIAEDLEVENKVVGKLANQLDVKLKNCQLGCF